MPSFTIHTFMHQDNYILGHNDFLLHPSTAIIITITIIIILPYVNSTQLQQHETDTVFTPVQDDSNLRQPPQVKQI